MMFRVGGTLTSALGFCILFVGLCLTTASAWAEDSGKPAAHRQFIQQFIDAVKTQDRMSIAGRVAYPLRRDYPIPEVGSVDELLIRFDEVFDDAILKKIATSDIDEDWATMGSQGIMLGQGELWMNFQGKIIAVNHETAKTTRLTSELNAKQKASLHESVRQFAYPHLMWQTEKFTIRIDQLENDVLRYASWAKGKPLSEKPDLVLTKGKLDVEGTARNLVYHFTSGPYRYECRVIEMSPMDGVAPRSLHVFKNGVEILVQPALNVL